MNIEVIAIGDEVLAGFTVNSNAARISVELTRIGLQPTSHRVLPDDASALRSGLMRAIRENELVICCGGLGPTGDDRTRQALAKAVDCELGFNKEVAERLRERYGATLSTLEDQATIPLNAQPLHNSVGTAPGLLFLLRTSVLILLPGVPLEMEALLGEQVIPFLQDHFKEQIPLREAIHFFQLPEATIDPVVQSYLKRYPKMDYGIYPGLGVVTVRLVSKGAAPEALQAVRDGVVSAFPDNTFPADVETLEEAIQRRCVEDHLTVSVAESCTGGAIAARLTRLPGASQYFVGSCVTYSNTLKQSLLGVQAQTLEQHGAVSGEVVAEMVEGVLKQTGTDLGVAVSGIAGPAGGTEQKPVGTVWVAVGRKGQIPVTSSFRARGNRAAIIVRSVNYALAELWKLIR